MNIQILFFEGCPNHAPTVELTERVVADLDLDVDVRQVELKNPDDAERLRFFGSPTVQIDGVDIDPAMNDRSDYAFGCRRYGVSGVPPREMIEAALKKADK